MKGRGRYFFFFLWKYLVLMLFVPVSLFEIYSIFFLFFFWGEEFVMQILKL